MTDWQAVMADDFTPATGRTIEELLDELSAALRSPDPVLRDEQAFRVMAAWIGNGTADGHLERLGDEMADRLSDPEIQTRTFAPLILACIVAGGTFKPQWLAAFTDWYPNETDLRGHDEKLGWLHAVAHGADLLGELGLCDQVDPLQLPELAARRMLAATEYVWRDLDDNRLALALASILTRPEFDQDTATAWLDLIAAEFAGDDVRPPPAARTSNTMRTLQALYILVDRGVRLRPDADAQAIRHREAIKDRIAQVLALKWPFSG